MQYTAIKTSSGEKKLYWAPADIDPPSKINHYWVENGVKYQEDWGKHRALCSNRINPDFRPMEEIQGFRTCGRCTRVVVIQGVERASLSQARKMLIRAINEHPFVDPHLKGKALDIALRHFFSLAYIIKAFSQRAPVDGSIIVNMEKEVRYLEVVAQQLETGLSKESGALRIRKSIASIMELIDKLKEQNLK